MIETTLGDLAPGAYYTCAAASNSVGTTYGPVVRFDVAMPPSPDGGVPEGGVPDSGVPDGGPDGAGGAGGAGGRGGAGGGGVVDGGGSDANKAPATDKGCGCGLANDSPGLGGIAALLMMVGLTLRRRRKS